MKAYLLKVDNEFLKLLKVEAAKAGITMGNYIVKAVLEKIKKDK